MKNVNIKNTKYLYLETKTRKEYQEFIKLVMKHTDKVCFTVRPFLDKFGITLEDPAFIKDGEVVCYTITHEEYCCIEEELYLQLVK